MIADSCFIIDIMREDQAALEKLEQITKMHQVHYITAPSVMELAVGIVLANIPTQEKRKVENILKRFQILPLDTSSAWRAGLESGKLRNKGINVDPIDAQIAGIALEVREVIVTRNEKHFTCFPDLQVESY